jgi:hypothetical protein
MLEETPGHTRIEVGGNTTRMQYETTPSAIRGMERERTEQRFRMTAPGGNGIARSCGRIFFAEHQRERYPAESAPRDLILSETVWGTTGERCAVAALKTAVCIMMKGRRKQEGA